MFGHRFIRNFIKLTLFVILFPLTSHSAEYSWLDLKKPFITEINVCHNEAANITVDIKEEFLKSLGKCINFGIDVISHHSWEMDSKPNFRYHDCKLRFNGRPYGSYKFPANATPAKQYVNLKIKTKYLKIGKNIITFSFGWKYPGFNCNGNCCGYDIKKISIVSLKE
jgi:hypothetical protein